MGLGDLVSDLTPDVIEDAVEDGTKWVGDRVEDAGDWTADRLEDVGWDSGADWVREQSRSVANRMGAEVEEMDLGQTEDEKKLIYGSPSEIRSTATHLKNLQGALDNVGGGLKGLDASELKGKTADAFRDSVSIEPPKWFKASDAFEKAAGALESFAGTVEWAQGQAQLAIDKWKAGTKASEEAMDAHKKKCDTFNKAVDTYNALPSDKRDPATLPPRPGEFTDPGKARMEEAQRLLTEARTQRNTAAETARTAVAAARDTAPKKPSYAEQAMDGLAETQIMNTHFVGGIAKGTAGLLNFVRTVNPMDPYNLTHPAEYALALNNTAAGLVQVANDPWGTGKQMVTDFMKDPAEGLGRLVPDLVLTAATGGGGAAVKGARTAKELADLAQDANKARRLIDDAPEGTHNRPDLERTTKDTDPVDLASGRMFLPQTDIVLPGVLPLAFTRRVESGYTAGRFFGPSWSSTVDERLEIDATGVIHLTDDGRLITYPHPVPGLPTRPETGTSRSTLERDAYGDYTLTDPDTGLIRHFDAPPGTGPGEDGNAWLGEISDRNNNTITFDRTDDGTPLALVHSAGHHLKLALADGLVTSLALTPTTGQNGLTTADPTAALPLRTYGYTDGNLTSVTKPSGASLTFAYDERRRVTAWIDSNNSRYSYAYDDRDRVVAEGGEAGHFQLTLTYTEPDLSTGNRTTTLTTADGRSTRHLVDSRCRVLATTDPLSNTTRDTFDASGHRLTHTDALGHTTTLSYDEEGRVSGITQADGARLRVMRDGLGHVTELVEPDGSRRLQEFNDHGNRTAVTDPGGSTVRYTYDTAGRIISVTDALGNVTKVRCDPAGLPVEISDPLGGTTRYDRDSLGRPVRVTDPLGAVTLLRWNLNGELAERTGPDGGTESWTYDGEGNRVTHTDPIGGTSRFEYTHFDLLAARTDPDGARYEFTHDADLRLTRVTNPQGLTWTYAYDRAGRLVSETDFDGRTAGYTVDAAGRMTASVTPLGETVSYSRDALGRVIRKDASGRVTTFAYDPAGRLVQANGPSTELIYQYDQAGRVKTELADGRATTYAYDALGRRTRRVTPTGRRTTYGYDAAGRPAELTCGERRITFAHDSAGRERERSFGGALTLASTWDAAGRLSTQHLVGRDRTTLNTRAYAYRTDGYLTGLDDSLNGSHRFDLDGAGRVTRVTAADWNEAYAYDAAGNQTAATWPSSHPGHDATGLRSYTGTTITRAGNTRYEHDAAGRITLRQKARLSRKPDTWRYEWDAEDRMTAATTPDGTRWRYHYDPLGRRIAKERLGDDHRTVVEETRFTWDGTTLCEQVTTATGLPRPIVLTWDHQGLGPLAQTERILSADSSQHTVDERFFAIVTDLVGTPTELVDETGSLAWHTQTTLWGTTTWARRSTAYTPLRFPGQYYDPETGLHHNHHRHYDPETARYTTPDPLGLAPAPNPSTYVHNPHTWSDPLGLAPRCLNDTGREGKDVNENFVPGSAEGQRLAEQLRRESAGSIFNENGWLTPDAIADSRRVIDGEKIGNPAVREAMTSDGSNLSDWGKYTTRTHQSPYGDFQVHYYYNPETGRVLNYDYKVIMNRR
ncbi:putative T7SS-secreted protein [Streptomyces sp. CB02488]|uniref:putative T7SS-secreted protein n=1 Tax=Streptomyces sp. CB02488 TaxID=1703920 RepID=UPI0009A0BF89|nr:RHS repeat-associated core domain-containing protein [Streptomyces sp. CB02488]